MKIAIKNPSPLGKNLHKWGDYHFGISLQQALEATGAEVTQHFWPEWDREDGEDWILVLRGVRRYLPSLTSKKKCAIWVISHPCTVLPEEIDAFDVAFVASEKHLRLLSVQTATRLYLLRQCTDPTIFHFPRENEQKRRGIIFAGNSRGLRRKIISIAESAGVMPSLIGRSWEGRQIKTAVQSNYIPNRELGDVYRFARLGLNDHWNDMAHYGYINNRIFDYLASGLPIISDKFEELWEVCGDSILYASDAASMAEAMLKYYLDYPLLVSGVRDLWTRIGSGFTFGDRAKQIYEVMEHSGNSRTRRLPAPNAQSEKLSLFIQKLVEPMKKKPVRVLHVCPSAVGIRVLDGNSEFSYLSGGLGNGPWHVDLKEGINELPAESIDLVVAEHGSGIDQSAVADLLSQKIANGGGFVFCCEDLYRYRERIDE